MCLKNSSDSGQVWSNVNNVTKSPSGSCYIPQSIHIKFSQFVIQGLHYVKFAQYIEVLMQWKCAAEFHNMQVKESEIDLLIKWNPHPRKNQIIKTNDKNASTLFKKDISNPRWMFQPQNIPEGVTQLEWTVEDISFHNFITNHDTVTQLAADSKGLEQCMTKHDA